MVKKSKGQNTGIFPDTFNRFDAGLRLGCGFEYDMVYAEIGYDWGLTNISKSDFDATHTRNLFINVGVNF